jgi:hypothetical protein
MADVRDLRTRIRDKIRSGKLPQHIPEKLISGFGGGHACDGCDEKIDGAQIEYDVDLPDSRLVRLHIGCSGLWQTELLKDGIGREQTPAAVSALILEHSLCLGCIGARVGATYDAVRRALATIETMLELHRENDGLCRACRRALPVFWVRLPALSDPDA